MANFRIRPAVADDVPLILYFIRALAEYERLADRCVATEELIRESLFGPMPRAEVILAYEDERPVGFALFFHNYSTFLARPGLYLEDLFVEPDTRGKGYGRQLLAKLAAIARARGCGRMEWAVLNWNEPSIGFYKALGAKPIDEWTTFRLTGDALNALAETGEQS